MWHDQICNLAVAGGAGETTNNEGDEAPSVSWLCAAAAAQKTIMESTDETNAATSADVNKVGNAGSVENVDVGALLSETKLSSNKSNGTTSANPPTSNENEQSLEQNQTLAQNFATEHRIFLRAILDLLTERDQRATEADINGLNNTIKIGSLRKASHRIKGLWKTKYVEIRKGTFSYFDDTAMKQGVSYSRNGVMTSSISNSGRGSFGNSNINSNNSGVGHQLLRKDIPLKASTCTCRAVKIRSVKVLPSTTSGGAVFELRIQGGSRRLWMANTREERQSWMQAIHNACIGASVTRGDNFLEYQLEEDLGSSSRRNKKKNAKQSSNIPINSPYKKDIEQYLEVREATHNADAQDGYVLAFANLRGKTITVPVQWIKTQISSISEDTNKNMSATSPSTFHETEIASCVEQLWKDLLRDSVEINGEVLAGDSFHGPERIVGRLTQQILSLGTASCSSTTPSSEKNDSNSSSTRITEAQAISYARDILLACDRTRSGGDSYFCAENLCLNRDLVVLCPSSTEANPLSIQVSACGQQQSNSTDLEDISGWVLYRSKSGKQKKQYLVLSQGILSGYAEADPKPHGFLGKMVLQGAKVGKSSSQKNVQTSKKKKGGESTITGHNIITITTKDGKHIREYHFEDEFDYLIWYDALCKSASSHSDKDGDNQASNGTNGVNGFHQTVPKVDVVVNVCTEYKLCTLDPSGIESEDTWGELRTTFIQKFSLTGGHRGRISRGDEVVQLDVL